MGPVPDKDAKTLAMLAHLLGIVGFLGPLIIWLIKKDQSPFVEDQGREALNFELTVLIGLLPLMVLSLIPFVGCVLFLLLIALLITNLVFCIMAALQANNGVPYRYPVVIRFITK